MLRVDDVVITGFGCVTPIGIGADELTRALNEGQCGVRLYHELADEQQTAYFAAPVEGFEGKHYVTPRKALKVMSREVQMAYSAAKLAWDDAGCAEAEIDPDRTGVIYGSEIIPGDYKELASAVSACVDEQGLDTTRWGSQFLKQIYPLWMLRNLPNMPACHVGIAVDARGPNNTIVQDEVSALLALNEAMAIIQRGQADVMIVGAVGNRVSPTRLSYRLREFYDQHSGNANAEPHCVPFSDQSRGIVASEGSAAIVLETRAHAVKRGASILGRVASCASRCGKPAEAYGASQEAISGAVTAALAQADLEASSLSHINAQGFSFPGYDQLEAAAIAESAPGVPVCAYSSYFGTAGAACGMLELCGSLVAQRQKQLFPVLGYPGGKDDASKDIDVVDQLRDSSQSAFLKTSFTPFGHAAAAVIECEN